MTPTIDQQAARARLGLIHRRHALDLALSKSGLSFKEGEPFASLEPMLRSVGGQETNSAGLIALRIREPIYLDDETPRIVCPVVTLMVEARGQRKSLASRRMI
jgi:hypothetical protein